MNRVLSTFLAAALVFGLAASSSAQSPVGDWDLNVESPQGAQTVTLSLTADGEKATGSLTSMMGSMPITGSVVAGKLAVTGNLEAQGMALPLGLNGNFTGDTVSGTMKVGDFGEFPFSGKRVVKNAQSAAPASAAPGAAAAPAAGSAASSSGVAGKWNVTLTLPGMGEFPLTADLTQTGSAVTGKIASMAGEVDVKGTFEGTSLKIEFNADTPQGPLPVTMTGELSATGLVGKAGIAGIGEADWKAVRP